MDRRIPAGKTIPQWHNQKVVKNNIEHWEKTDTGIFKKKYINELFTE